LPLVGSSVLPVAVEGDADGAPDAVAEPLAVGLPDGAGLEDGSALADGAALAEGAALVASDAEAPAEPLAADAEAPAEPDAPGDPLLDSVGTGVGDAACSWRSIGSVLMSMNPFCCLTTIAWRPFCLKTVATWSGVTFGFWNRSCHVVPPV
jgi:hypothetical protein